MQDPELRSWIDLSRCKPETVGMPTLKDILAELAKPGEDPRNSSRAFSFTRTSTPLKTCRHRLELPAW
ncbi:MAG: hypothetical protein MZU95_14560 [Desulfomicrobium escambiense]|nr:hypothetical protein [Desulfomicrobium escambiense]